MPQPDFLTTTAALPSGETVTIRLMQSSDVGPFIAYLESLSSETRAFYGPHRFDRETAAAICADLHHSDILRLAAFVRDGGQDRMIAYFLLKMGVLESDRQRYSAREDPLDAVTDCTLAPSVADEYQDRGLGSRMMRHVLQCAARLGRSRVVLWGGVQALNLRAVHFYTKFGFRKVGEFTNTVDNYDMILDLKGERSEGEAFC